MNILILFLLIGIYTCQSLACTRFGRYYPGDPSRSSMVFSVIYGVVVTLFTLCYVRFQPAISMTTVYYGLINGVMVVLYNQFLLRSSSMGPYSIVMIFMLSGGLMLPVLWSTIAGGVALPWFQWLAVGMMLVSFVLLNVPKKGEKVTLPFLITCVLLMFVNGIYCTLMNSQQDATQNMENAGMIIVTFATGAVISFLLLLFKGGVRSLKKDFTLNLPSLLWGLASALSAAVAVNILMLALAMFNVAVVFAMSNGGTLLVSVMISLLFLGEKGTLLKSLGILLASAAIVILSIPV